MNKIQIYDTTLRDGAQAEGISFSIEDKILISRKLDEMGIDYIEGGWPLSNPKDAEFFREARKLSLKHASLVAFGSTRHPKYKPCDDPNLKSLIECGVKTITIFGKTWDMHVRKALKISLEENLELIFDSIQFLKSHVEKVFFDAEHFFDGFKENQEYAMKVLEVSTQAEADCLVLCDTNGGTLPGEMRNIIKHVRSSIQASIGIHTHNDSGTAVASSLAAVEEGVKHIHGTINGYGERCGNANLCSIIPNLVLKMGKECSSKQYLVKLRELSLFVAELAIVKHDTHQPYVGSSAFAHKGGIHVSAVEKYPRTYEHIVPELVGNERKVLISELSGKASIINKARDLDIDLTNISSQQLTQILKKIKELEHKGYLFEGADASFFLFLQKEVYHYENKFFFLEGTRVIVEKRGHDEKTISEATVKVQVGDKFEHTAADGDGPVNALDRALRKALEKFYPTLSTLELLDYKVRIIDEHGGTRSVTRVFVESGDQKNQWGTVGVSENIIEASLHALVDSIEYKLLMERKENKSSEKH